MQTISKLCVILGIVLGLFGLRSFWRDYGYRKASTAVKAEVISVEVNEVKSTVSQIVYTLVFIRDNYPDTIIHTTSRNHNFMDPLPSLETLKMATKYVRYVPDNKKADTAFPERFYVIDNSSDYYESMGRSWFLNMTIFIFFGYMIKPWRLQTG